MTRALSALASILVFVGLAGAQAVGAQPVPTNAPTATAAKDTNIDDAYVDFAVPDVAALGLFGVNPNKVTRPGNLKEFSLAVLPLAAGDDTIGAGIAFSWAPVYTFARSVNDYRNGALRRFSFSVATTKDKTSVVSLAGGARLVLVDRTDPLMDDGFHTAILRLLNASLAQSEQRNTFRDSHSMVRIYQAVAVRMTSDPVSQAQLIESFLSVWDISKPLASSAPDQVAAFQKAINQAASPTQQISAIDIKTDAGLRGEVEEAAAAFVEAAHNVTLTPTAIKSQLARLRQNYLEAHWNAPVVVVDGGALGDSASGTWSQLTAQKIGASVSAAVPIESAAQLLVQVQGRKGLGGSPKERSYYSGGGRLLIGGGTRRFSAEGLVSKASDSDLTKNGVTKRVTLGTEFRITDGFWIEVAFGSQWAPSVSGQSSGSLLSLANLKYAFKSTPRYSQIPGSDEDAK